MAEAPLVSAIVVSYNTRETTLRCLEALLADLAGLRHEVSVVDNASTDGSADAIAAAFPDVHLIRSERNLGFGAANNLAMSRATGDFFLLVNSDAFLRPGAARALLDCMAAHPEAAVAGPRLLNPDGSLQRSCFRFPSPGRAVLENLFIASAFPGHRVLGDYRHWPHDHEREVDWVVGACVLVRQAAYGQVGGFDEQFFMYAEETDWQKRMREAGWKVVFTPAAEVTHLGGGSAEESGGRNERMFESLDRYALKHHGPAGLLLLRAAMLAGCSLRAAGWAAASFLPGRRSRACEKARLHLWLLKRQSLTWPALHRRVS